VPSPIAVWRVDVFSVQSATRDAARRIDQSPVGNRDGKISVEEVDAAITRREAERGRDEYTQADAANESLRYTLTEGVRLPLVVDLGARIVRAPMTGFSDWLERTVMGNPDK
jgi:hypothetical protein